MLREEVEEARLALRESREKQVMSPSPNERGRAGRGDGRAGGSLCGRAGRRRPMLVTCWRRAGRSRSAQRLENVNPDVFSYRERAWSS